MVKQPDEQKSMLTQDGYDKLQLELEERKQKRVEIANKLEEATEQGDLSENASYKAALEEKELNENRIGDIELILTNVEIIVADTKHPAASLGNKVTLTKLEDNTKYTYILVDKSESNPAEGMISIQSPVGKAVYGHKKGDKIVVNLTNNQISYTIDEIN